MTNLNLNITISDDGFTMADIYILTGVNPETDDCETLGYFTDRSVALKQLEFWTKVMDYKDARIEYNVLRLN